MPGIPLLSAVYRIFCLLREEEEESLMVFVGYGAGKNNGGSPAREEGVMA